MTARLTIVSVAFPFARVGPEAVGGAEQVLSMIDEALVAAGHRSIVVALEGSRCAGELVPVPPVTGMIEDRCRDATYRSVRRVVDEVAARAEATLVHMHGVDFHAYLPASDVPVLATLHLPLALYPDAALRPQRPRTWLHGVSHSQMRDAPAAMPRVADIANGVDLARFTPDRGPRRRYAVVLSRICPEKGVHVALDAARAAAIPMLLAGRVFPYESHLRYYRDEVAPRLDHGRRFIGAVGPTRKRLLLSRARCLLVPSSIAETSSLVAMEALACGTPVVAFRVGALNEIVHDGVTGLLVDHGSEALARGIRSVGAIDRATCRGEAERRFDARATARSYLAMYERLARAAREGQR